MKLSIIIPVLNSHEIVRRQLLHFDKMPLPDDVELILIDDGSTPPIERAIPTNDFNPWTQPKARNMGASLATGETFLFTDIDHIVDSKAVEFGRVFPYDYGRFYRDLGILDKDGNFTQDPEILIKWGVPEEKARENLHIRCHTTSQYIKADVFSQVGGFRENKTIYPTHDDGDMKGKLNRAGLNKCPDDERPNIYMFPNGRYCGEKNFNPFGFFHTLQR